jgi:hypothetical protein
MMIVKRLTLSGAFVSHTLHLLIDTFFMIFSDEIEDIEA